MAIAVMISILAFSVITSSPNVCMVNFENFSGILKLASQLEDVNEDEGDDCCTLRHCCVNVTLYIYMLSLFPVGSTCIYVYTKANQLNQKGEKGS